MARLYTSGDHSSSTSLPPHSLSIGDWRSFFITCEEILGGGDAYLPNTQSYCAITTFDRLTTDLHYWGFGLPHSHEIGEAWIADGGTWGQPFAYETIAHLIIPRRFAFEQTDPLGNYLGDRPVDQDIDRLSPALRGKAIAHRLSDLVLEIQCY